MKTVYPDENNVVQDEKSVERKPCINRESKSLDITIKLYSFHDINMKFLVVVTPPSIYQYATTHATQYLIHVQQNKSLAITLVTLRNSQT